MTNEVINLTTYYYKKSEIDTLLNEKADIDSIPTKTSDLTNDSSFLTEHQDISGKENISNKSSNITVDTGSTIKYPTVNAVENYAEPKKPVGTLEDFKSLIEDATAGQVIILDRDYKGTKNCSITLKKTVTIIGNGHTINANNYRLVISLGNGILATLTFIDCIFTNINVDGASYPFIKATPFNRSNLTLHNCIIKNSTVKGQFITGMDNNNDGVVFNITNCIFYNNTVNSSASGLLAFVNNNFNVLNTVFENNTVTSIFVRNVKPTTNQQVVDCTFNNNTEAIADASDADYKVLVLKNNQFLGSGDTISGCTNNNYLTQHQDISGKVNISDVKDNLTSSDVDKPLSANQGKVLKELVDGKADTSHTHSSSDVTDNSAYTNIGSGVNATQKIINDKINTALGIKANANDVYARNETYTQSEITTLISNAVSDLQLFEVVNSLPTSNIKTNRLYLIVNDETITNNEYDIYLRVNDDWEQLDSLEFDISNFYNKTEVDTLLSGKVDTSDSRLTNARTPTSHSHGDITNTGAIGTDANKPLITTTDGKITTGSFGTTPNTFCQGNDSRLRDARMPLPHFHSKGEITDLTIPTKVSELTNDSGYLTSHQDISGKEDTSNKVTTISSSSTNTQYPSAKAVYDELPKTTKTLTVTYTNGTTEDIEFYIR